MRKVVVMCPEDLALDLEKANYETMVLQQMIDRYIDNHPEIEDPFDSKIGTNLINKLTAKQTEYETLKSILTRDVIPDYLKEHRINWELNFLDKEVTITILCDCEIPQCPEE